MSVQKRCANLNGEIDAHIASLPIWNNPRDTLLRKLLDHYRDAIEVFHLAAFRSRLSGDQRGIQVARVLEHDLRTGVFRSLIWAMDLSRTRTWGRNHGIPRSNGSGNSGSWNDLPSGRRRFETAKHNLTEILLDKTNRLVTCTRVVILLASTAN